MTNTITTTIGCDLGDRRSHFCVLDSCGEVVERSTFATTENGVRKTFGSRKRSVVVIECGTQSPWMSEILSSLGHRVIVANPRRIALIAKSRNKTDRRDAEDLARLARFDLSLVAPIQHRGAQARADLAHIRARSAMVRARAMLVNHVRGVVKANGGRIASCSTSAFSKRARAAVPEAIAQALDPLLEQIGELTERIKAAKKTIMGEIAERYPTMRLLQQIHGVGPITAATYVLTLEDPHRFRRNRDVGAFLGLTPARRQSGRIDPELRITKAGDRFLRSMLVECAQYILSSRSSDSDLKRWGLELAARGRKAAKKRAVIAVARKLAVLMCSMWKTGTDYVPVGHGRVAVS